MFAQELACLKGLTVAIDTANTMECLYACVCPRASRFDVFI